MDFEEIGGVAPPCLCFSMRTIPHHLAPFSRNYVVILFLLSVFFFILLVLRGILLTSDCNLVVSSSPPPRTVYCRGCCVDTVWDYRILMKKYAPMMT